MLIDDITIKVRAGSGGKGAVAFNKNLGQYGPTGGTGGDGGSVYAEGVSNLGILNKYRFKKEFFAENGQNGRGQFCDGVKAKDFTLYVPAGTIIHNLATGVDREVVAVGERVLLAAGGRGGKGNFHFRSSTNTRPRQFKQGTPGEEYTIRLELKLIADVGLIGLPNVGKSSLLNELTAARSRVANYLFTTLEPNLGAYFGLIIADIPGLIEGASGGKGLGIKFLRHIERTRVLFHMISAESPDPLADYKTIRKELTIYNKILLKKKEYIFLSKSDMVSPVELQKKVAALKKGGLSARVLSIHDIRCIEDVKTILQELIQEKSVFKQ